MNHVKGDLKQSIRDRRNSIIDSISHQLDKLSKRERNVLLIGLVTSVVILSYVFGIEPLAYQHNEMKLEASRVANRVNRFKSVVETSEGNRAKNQEYIKSFNLIRERCFEGKTEDIAAGKLIELITRKASKAKINIKSTKVEKVRIIPGFKILNIRVSFEAPLNRFALFTQSIEKEKKKIMFREAKIHSQKERYRNDKEERLSVELVISALQYIE